MLCLSLAQPAMQLHFTLAGAFRGAGDTVTPLYAAFVGNWLFRVPLAFLAANVWHLDLIWIWLTLILDHIARAVWLLWSFVRGSWRR
jgi:Na+-driven multidrug efflux pump